jgi:lysophospholipase L1-like esterase
VLHATKWQYCGSKPVSAREAGEANERGEGMQQILVYGDSLSWGIVPGTRQRLGFTQRWPGVMEHALVAAGKPVRVVENCLNGRRTVWEDPFKPGRKGVSGLAQQIEAQSPLALVVLMLGTNDFQSTHVHVAWHAAQGVATLVAAIRSAPIEPGMPVPPILVVAPPAIQTPRGTMADKFAGGDRCCVGLADAYRTVCEELGCAFFDAGSVIAASPIDGVHLDAAQHLELGQALTRVVTGLLPAGSA